MTLKQISIVIEIDKSVDEYALIESLTIFIKTLKLKAEVVGTHVKTLKEHGDKGYY